MRNVTIKKVELTSPELEDDMSFGMAIIYATLALIVVWIIATVINL